MTDHYMEVAKCYSDRFKKIILYNRCAWKSLFRELTQSAQAEGSVRLADWFKDECIHMSKARHPNLVLFLGVYFQEN